MTGTAATAAVLLALMAALALLAILILYLQLRRTSFDGSCLVAVEPAWRGDQRSEPRGSVAFSTRVFVRHPTTNDIVDAWVADYSAHGLALYVPYFKLEPPALVVGRSLWAQSERTGPWLRLTVQNVRDDRDCWRVGLSIADDIGERRARRYFGGRA
jgi:hypothetical protein